MSNVNIDTLEGGTGDPSVNDTSQAVNILNLNKYEFMTQVDAGTHGFRDGTYLIPHSREMNYNSRRGFSFYKNFFKPTLRAMIEPVFSELAPRKVEDENGNEKTDLMFNDFIENCDNTGKHLQVFTEKVVKTARLHGVCFAVMDNFRPEEMPEVKGVAKEERKFPYVYMRTAAQVDSYRVDKFGNLISITFKDLPEQTTMEDGKTKTEDRWRTWTVNEVIISKKDKSGHMEVIETIVHGLGALPVISVYSVNSEDNTCVLVDPPLYDLARLNAVGIYNKDSEMRELERSQEFAVFCIQAESAGNVTIGANNVLFVPAGMNMPEYISPDSSTIKELRENQAALVDSFFQIAEQSGVTGVQSSKSGIAKQWDFFAHESVLKKTSAIATMLEEDIADLFKLYTEEEFVYIVDYPFDFQPNNIREEFEVLDMASLTDYGQTGNAMIKAKKLRLIASDESPEQVSKAVQEITDAVQDKQIIDAQDADV